jgi:copper transport protein
LTQPARGPRFEAPDAVTVRNAASTWQRADDLLVSFALRPDQPGENYVTVGVFDTRRPAPGTVGAVAVTLQDERGRSQTIDLIPDGANRWQETQAVIPHAGSWTASIRISRPGLPETSMTTRWTVSPLPPSSAREPTLISSRPLRPLLDAAAAMLAFVMLFLGVVTLLRRRAHNAHVDAAAPSEPSRGDAGPGGARSTRDRGAEAQPSRVMSAVAATRSDGGDTR